MSEWMLIGGGIFALLCLHALLKKAEHIVASLQRIEYKLGDIKTNTSKRTFEDDEEPYI
jgi:hypothetical protein